jgi:hypothetical protein
VDLEPLALHDRSGMPLAQEYRTFYLDGDPLVTAPYWEQGPYDSDLPPTTLFQDIAQAVRSRFFSLDVARQRTGEWLIIELGDGQVASLPEAVDVQAFYATLKTRLMPG